MAYRAWETLGNNCVREWQETSATGNGGSVWKVAVGTWRAAKKHC